MSQDLWTGVDTFIDGLSPADAVLDAARARAEAAGLPDIAVTLAQGRWLTVLARAIGASRILEIGTLGGFSTICLARGLTEGGRVTTLEIAPRHAAVAAASFAAAGLSAAIDLRLGPASDSLRELAREHARFDLVFIDADKGGYPEYLRLVRPLLRTGSLIVADNVVRGGRVADPGDDADTRGVRTYLEQVARDPGLIGTVLQTVGAKGHDGFSVAVVVAAET